MLAASILLAVPSNAQNYALDSLELMVSYQDGEQAVVWQNSINPKELSKFENAKFEYLSGQTFLLTSQIDKAYESFIRAKNQFIDLDSLGNEAEVNLQLATLIADMNSRSMDYRPYMDSYMQYAKKQRDPLLECRGYMSLGSILIDTLPFQTLNYFKKAKDIMKSTSDSLILAKINQNIGVVFAEKIKNQDSALYYYSLALPIYEKKHLTPLMSVIYNNNAVIYRNKGDYNKAIATYLKADSLILGSYNRLTKSVLYENLSEVYGLKNDQVNELKYLRLHLAYKDSINEEEQNSRISEIQAQYNVEKQENENLRLRQNRNRWFAVLIGIALLLILAYVSYRNARHKRLLVENEKALQGQKLEKVLKDQELNSIDAMITGQEKERQRIADDLHDNLGGLLATLKWNFQHLKDNTKKIPTEEGDLLTKTDDLIEETYQKVRRIAHARNAGVPAKEGLVPAVKNFAQKVSLVNKLAIDVEDHGMEERLENSLEITLFRIIQELTTNIIKHSQATQATIHLTNRQNELNIMVEDNGKGFILQDKQKNAGMGLNSIEKRVEYLNGVITIDSVLGKGTTIIIDIPIV